MASVAFKYVPQTAATTFAFSSDFFFFYDVVISNDKTTSPLRTSIVLYLYYTSKKISLLIFCPLEYIENRDV